jgi:hypothetical protein
MSWYFFASRSDISVAKRFEIAMGLGVDLPGFHKGPFRDWRTADDGATLRHD